MNPVRRERYCGPVTCREPLGLEICRRAQVESLGAERPLGRTSGTRIDSENVLSDKKSRISEGLGVISQYTGGEQKDYISPRLNRLRISQGRQRSQRSQSFKKIIKYLFSVSPVCSVREIYSAMHNIMAMEKSAKRLTVMGGGRWFEK